MTNQIKALGSYPVEIKLHKGVVAKTMVDVVAALRRTPVQQVYAARFRRKFGAEDELSRYVSALYDMLASVLGQDKLVLRAGKSTRSR